MQPLLCSCGHTVYCDNTACLSCGKIIGFDPVTLQVLSVLEAADGNFYDELDNRYRLCANRRRYGVCNGLVAATDYTRNDALCSSCQLNRIIPIVDRPENLMRWQRLEAAKRRMIAGLTTLSLKVGKGNGNPAGAMRFDFMEDQRSHPDVLETFVSTGHKNGLITINLMEADEVQRVQQRELSGERQRTLLGHFRHEAGHYFYTQIVSDLNEFEQLFGNPLMDYQHALRVYYDNGPTPDWGENFISAYASSHPMEDWAECFAHVLHILDGLETAAAYGLVDAHISQTTFSEKLDHWANLAISLNETNRSLGVRDPYPFVVGPNVAAKMRFVHQAIETEAVSRP